MLYIPLNEAVFESSTVRPHKRQSICSVQAVDGERRQNPICAVDSIHGIRAAPFARPRVSEIGKPTTLVMFMLIFNVLDTKCLLVERPCSRWTMQLRSGWFQVAKDSDLI